jgi:hypothetical protein
MRYGIGSWQDKYGNHRARIYVHQKADAVWVHILWRRRDVDPEKKNIIIIEASTEKQITNLVRIDVNREYGDLVFQADAPGEYYVYYMPFKVSGGMSFPTVTYPPFQTEADSNWLDRNRQLKWRDLPQADVLEIQARGEFHRFDPMEVIATAEETQHIIAQNSGSPYLLFPEDREYPVKMIDSLPFHWIRHGPGSEFHGEVQRGEFYTFQIGIYAIQNDIEQINVDFSDLKDDSGQVINASAFNCFNLGGSDWWGRSMQKTFSVPKGKVGTLWFGIQIPEDTEAGNYQSSVHIYPKNAEPREVKLYLTVAQKTLEDNGDSDLWRFSRLRWLDSKIGIDDYVTPPYMPLRVKDQTVECLGRSVRFDETGLLESIVSNGNEILLEPISFIIDSQSTKSMITPAKVTKQSFGTVIWESNYTYGNFTIHCLSKMDYDGYLNFQITIKAERDTSAKDMRLEISIRREFAKFMMGMGHKGGYRSKEWKWKWDRNLHQDSVWIGDTDAGIQCKLKGPDYTWPLVNIHYKVKPLNLPEAWYNDGKGGCEVVEVGDDKVILKAYSGERHLESGQELHFDFGLLITPVKPLDIAKHSKERYYHAYHPVDQVLESGANVINIHHGNELNPYINYPFIAVDKLKAYVQEGHEKNLKVKIYYTLRELSNHIAEMPAIRSIGDEVFISGSGGGYSWLQEHLVSDYAPAWHHWFPDGDVDAALVTAGLSRWHNYYLEGLSWLLKNIQIDGLYIDDLGYDREVMKRVRKILDQKRPGCLIDLHSWNHFNDMAGWANCLNLYMEHTPYIDSLWIGEGFDYNESPEYWLVEISGIPFGLFSEMLESGGNPWRGMIYGMTTRFPYSGDPRPIWKIWDEFGIQDAKMIGYWSESCPVRTDNKDILATVYAKSGKVLVALASWAKESVDCQLQIDWKALGMDQDKTKIYAPAISGFQEQAEFQSSDAINTQPGRGWLLVIEGF